MAITPAEALSKIMDARVADARVRYSRTLNNLINMGRVKAIGKTSIDWDVRFSGTTSKREAVTANVTADNGSNTVPANLRIGRQRLSHTFNISKIAITEAMTLAPASIKDLFAAQVDDALSVLMRDLNDLIWNGDGTAASAEVTGLMTVLNNAVPYATIDPTIYLEWKALTLTNGTARPFTRSLMLSLDELLDTMEEGYDMVCMHPTTLTTYKALFDSMGGIAAVGQNVITLPDNIILPRAELGHAKMATFNGTTIMTDPKIPVGNIVLLDTSQIDLFIYDAAVTPTSPNDNDEVINYSYGLPIRIAEIDGQNPDQRTFNLRVHPQLRVFNRKSLKAICNLT